MYIYFLGVMLDCPCMLFWQLEARTWHDEGNWRRWHKIPPSHVCLATPRTRDWTYHPDTELFMRQVFLTQCEVGGKMILKCAPVSVGLKGQSEARCPLLLKFRWEMTEDPQMSFFICCSWPAQEWCWLLWHRWCWISGLKGPRSPHHHWTCSSRTAPSTKLDTAGSRVKDNVSV